MSDNNSNADTNKYLFINLVTMFSITAMQQLGKIINPAVGKAGINLEAAQATIDTLDMLSAKTEGKLDNEEARFLKDTLAMLKMNYVETREEEERKAGQKSDVRDQKSEVSGQNHESQPQREDKKTGEQEESKQTGDPKFHKSYG